MQVSVEKTSEISRKMTVNIPQELFSKKMEDRFKSLAQQVKIDGFRPGKVPMQIIKQRYSERVKGEVTGDLIQSSYYDALKQHELVPVGQPHIHDVATEGDLGYVAVFEVIPEISLDPIKALKINRPVATVESSDHDDMIEKLRQQRKTWNEVDRSSVEGDKITIHFSGVCNDENFTDGKVENYEVEIGSKSMIPGFEDQLIGLQAGDAKTFDIVFPEPYGNPKLAGQSAQFEIEVAKVEEALLPEIDEEFIKAYGVEDGLRASFDEQLKNHMEKELARALKTKLKDSVLNQLNESFTFDIPKALIDEQVEVLKQNYLQEVKQRNIGADSLDIPASQFEDSARNRVKLALIMGEVIRQNEIQLEQDRVKEFVSQIASSYENPQEVVSWYLSDKERLNDIKQLILEEQAIDWIVDHADVSDETLSFQSVMQTASN